MVRAIPPDPKTRGDTMPDLYDAPDSRFAGFQSPQNWYGWNYPALSQDVAVMADEANFYPVGTGGGCTALEFTFTDGAYLLITDDAAIPESVSDPVTLGLYDASGENVAWAEYPNLRAALDDCDAFVRRANDQRAGAK